MKNLSQMLKSAQAMQGKMAEMQEEMANMSAQGSAGAGMVTVTLSGKWEMSDISIDPSLFTSEEKEVLEDLIAAAYNDARQKMQDVMQEKMSEMTGGLPLPEGFKMPF